VDCPKERNVGLVDGVLSQKLAVQHCPGCQGNWIPAANYASWKDSQPESEDLTTLVDRALEMTCESAPLDARAALCPECNCYLVRARISLKPPFYIERCPNCKGIWCDRGEWEALEQVGLHRVVDRLFVREWQTLVREREQLAQERRATVEKLGAELADRIFELAEVLEKHPYGDFGVAYLMRRFDK
jgi:Zn-finger nucleic acid-binding protein